MKLIDDRDPARDAQETPIINVVGELVALGPLRRDLLVLYQRWVNDLGAVRNLGFPPQPMTMEAETAWFERAAAGESTSFTIYERAGMRPIGNAGLHGVDYRNRTAEFGILIGESNARGKGYGTESTRLMLDFAFTALGLNNVMLRVFAYNAAGMRAYQKAGFREFGRRREAQLMGDRLWDVVYMECLASEFTSPVLGAIFTPDEPRPNERRS